MCFWHLKKLKMRRMFKSSYVLSALLIMFAVVTVSCGSSRKTIGVEEGWDLLGEQKVNFVRNTDVVTVYNTNRYTAVRFKVEQRDIRLSSVKVVYENGDKLTPTLDDDIAADQYSRVIELGPEGKAVRSIEFRYRTKGNVLKGRAKVLVFGKRYTQSF